MSAGPEFYDEEPVFQTYLQRHNRLDGPEDTLEMPVLRELIGAFQGQAILDLGCGGARFGKELLAQGAASYLGVDGSQNMLALARATLSGTPGQVVLSTLQDWQSPSQAFDLAISLLALHYLPDLDALFQKVYGALKPGGRFIFSVEHPVITSCDRAWQSGLRQEWIVDDYFKTGLRTTNWMGGEVIKYHRTVEDYYLGLQAAGFRVDGLRESRPQRERFIDEATFTRRLRIPLFLFLAASKP